MPGTIVTFYSYKGGVGRTFALANTAATLARWGYRVLCVDWDLDAPGLSYYFQRWLPGPVKQGLVDLVRDGETDPERYAMRVALPGTTGRLHLIPAGAADDRYVESVQALNWANLYDDRDFGATLEHWRRVWKRTYDVVLVDSRTGITDIGGICTAHLPEIVVMLFTANEQSLAGTLDVARRAVAAHDRLPYDRGGLMIVPVPSRFDAREEYKRAERWQERITNEVQPLLANWSSRHVSPRRLLAHLTIPYVSYWSFGEELPALTEPQATPEKISYALEVLAALLAHRLGRTELLADNRESYVSAAARAGLRNRETNYDVFLSHDHPDFPLARRIAAGLTARGLRVFSPTEDDESGERRSGVTLDVLSSARNLVALVGPSHSGTVVREVERFLRQTLDEDTGDRFCIPVLTPHASVRDLPQILRQFQYTRMSTDEDVAVNTVVVQVVRAIASQTATRSQPGIRGEALDLLDESMSWQLDPLRWQLFEQDLIVLRDATVENDEERQLDAMAELESLRLSATNSRGLSRSIGMPSALYREIARTRLVLEGTD